MFAAASAAAVSTATAMSTATAARVSAATAAATTDRRTGMAGMNDRRTGMAGVNARRTGMTGMNDRCVRVTGVTAPAAGMSATPMMPAVAAAPADAGREVLTAPVPARPVPTVVIPAIIVPKPDELRAFDHVQAVGRTANCSRRNHRSRADASAHDRCAGDENGCRHDGNSELGMNVLPVFDRAS